jgi:hypothetical protein
VYELEPEVVRAAETFRSLGGGLPAGARVAYGDGRKAVLGPGDALDVVSSDPVHPAVAGSAFLYSEEFYRGAMRRLSPEGVLVEWLPLYQLHAEDLRLVLRTFAASVPHPYCFLAGRDALLVGSRTPLRLSPARLDAALRRDAAADLRAQGLGTPGALLSLLVLDPEGCRAVGGAGDLNTDDRLVLELRSGWREADDEGAAAALLRSRPADPASLLDGPPDAAFAAGAAAGARLGEAFDAWVEWRLAAAAQAFEAAAGEDPANLLAREMRDEAEAERALEASGAGNGDLAVRLARRLLRREGVAPTRRLDAAEVLLLAGHAEEAAAAARPLAEAHRWPRAVRLAAGGR